MVRGETHSSRSTTVRISCSIHLSKKFRGNRLSLTLRMSHSRRSYNTSRILRISLDTMLSSQGYLQQAPTARNGGWIISNQPERKFQCRMVLTADRWLSTLTEDRIPSGVAKRPIGYLSDAHRHGRHSPACRALRTRRCLSLQ